MLHDDDSETLLRASQSLYEGSRTDDADHTILVEESVRPSA
jgi:hypothetical protein